MRMRCGSAIKAGINAEVSSFVHEMTRIYESCDLAIVGQGSNLRRVVGLWIARIAGAVSVRTGIIRPKMRKPCAHEMCGFRARERSGSRLAYRISGRGMNTPSRLDRMSKAARDQAHQRLSVWPGSTESRWYGVRCRRSPTGTDSSCVSNSRNYSPHRVSRFIWSVSVVWAWFRIFAPRKRAYGYRF